MSWTPEQEAAIIARGASVTVSAAAGSGKTSVLVERLTQLLADESHSYPAEKMIVVTFTNDAAGEVRKRLNQALSRKIGNEPENDWLRRQQTMLHSAKISTIHGFCFDLLREHFSALDIPSSFRIMEPKEEDELRTAAAAEVLEAFYQRAETDAAAAAERRLLNDAFCGKDDSMLDALLLKIYDLETETPFGEYLTDDAAAACENGSIRQRALEMIAEQTEAALTLYAEAKKIAADIGFEKAVDAANHESGQITRLRDAAADGDLSRISEILEHFEKVKQWPRKTKLIPDEKAGSIKALRTHAVEIIVEMQETWTVPLKYAESDLKRHAAILRALSGLMRAFSEALNAKKRERGALGFSDAIIMALSLLAVREPDGSITKTALAETLSEQYVCIMIDEFQDADNQQDLIFRMLSRGGSAERYGSNLFVVGDSKQCIYRFRNANPENFYNAMREGAEYHGPQLTENTCIRLNRNFRSAQEVVDTVNHVFSMLMTEAVGENRYDSTQALVRGADYPEAVRRTEILPFLKERNNGGTETEARLTAERIAFHLKNGTPVFVNGETRPCAPKDFLLLLRNSTHMPQFAAALKEHRIPVCSIEQKGYLDAPELRLLLDLLRAADNPLLEIPMTAAMLSPLFGFTLDEVLSLRLTDRKQNLFTSMNALRKAAEDGTEQPDPVLLRKCCALLDFLESMRLLSAIETPEQLIRRIYEQTDFLGMMQMTQGGAQKKANLRALLNYAAGFEETHGGGLSAFLRYIDAIRERGSDLSSGSVPVGTEDAVRIKTIHSSKGLEAPFVILADSDCGFSKQESGIEKLLRHHAKIGIGFELHDPDAFTTGKTLAWAAIDQQNQREQFSEELRLLYVALTRAREYLILPLPYGNTYVKDTLPQIAAEQAVLGQTDILTRRAKSYRDFLMMAVFRNPACALLRQELAPDTESDPHQPFLPVVILTEEEPEQAEEQTQPEAETADPALTALLTEQCRFVYESKEAHLTAKYGVSELAKEDDFSMSLRNPLFVREKHGLSGAERGTAIHTFMQYADFEAAAEDIAQEAERLHREGRLTARQKQAVEKSTIAQFFTSELYDRIRKSSDIRREQKFTVRLRDLQLTGKLAHLGADYENTDGMLIGIMDLVFAEDDGIVLVDYKTDRVKNSEELLEAYTEQIRLYAEALRLLTGSPVKACFLYSVALNRTVPVTL